MTPRLLAGLLLLLIYTAPQSVAAAQELTRQSLDQLVADLTEEWGVGAVAVAVVKDDKLVFANGYGTTLVGGGERVTADTLFMIGSISKGMTAAGLGMLVDDGKLGWDDPVSRRLPQFQMQDPYLAQKMTVRDLLTHRTGLAADEGNLLLARYAPNEVVAKATLLTPSNDFRTTFAYQNVLYVVAGEVLHAVSGTPWDAFMRSRIFEPLNMKSTYSSVDPVRRNTNLAQPSVRTDLGLNTVAIPKVMSVGAAGGIVSTANDMSRYLRLMLNNGMVDGKQLLKPATLLDLHTPVVAVPLTDDYRSKDPTCNVLTYGLGWYIHDDRGTKVIQHRGRFPGYSARITLVPEHNLGIVVLTNEERTCLPDVMCYELVDRMLGRGGEMEWSKKFREVADKRRAGELAMKQAFVASRTPDTKPTLSLDAYCCDFNHPAYGPIKISKQGEKLVFSYGENLVGDMTHWHYDSFMVSWRDALAQVQPGNILVTFAINHDAQVAEVSIGDRLTFVRERL